MVDIGAKTLFIDIETAPLLGYSWEIYDSNILHVVDDWYILSFAYRWGHDKKINVVSINRFPSRKSKDYQLCKQLFKLLNEADIVVAHNARRFDVKKIQARLKINGFPPPSPFKVIDTLKEARSHFKFTSNRLGYLGRIIGAGEKEKTGGFDLWLGCMKNDQKAWKKMEKYNAKDINLLFDVYEELKAWMPRHPNVGVYKGSEKPVCPICASKNIQFRGYYYTNTSVYHKVQCQECFGWSRLRKSAQRSVKSIVCDRA